MHLERDRVDLAGEASLGTDADAERHWRLIVDTDIGRLVGGEDVGLSLLDACLRNCLAVHEECRLATFTVAATVVGEVHNDCCRTAR